MAGTARNLRFLVEGLAPGTHWGVAGIGRAELPMAEAVSTALRVTWESLRDGYAVGRGQLVPRRWGRVVEERRLRAGPVIMRPPLITTG